MKLKNSLLNAYIRDSKLNQNSHELGILDHIDNESFEFHSYDNFSDCTFILFGIKPLTDEDWENEMDSWDLEDF